MAATDPTLEHLLPKNPGDKWPHVSDGHVEDHQVCQGNLTLLEHSLNKDLGNAEWVLHPICTVSPPIPSSLPAKVGRWPEGAHLFEHLVLCGGMAFGVHVGIPAVLGLWAMQHDPRAAQWLLGSAVLLTGALGVDPSPGP